MTTVLLATAVSVAFLHALVGVDHYLPFIVLARSGRWSRRRALSVTALCGLGHVLGSVVIGGVGIGLGLALESLEVIESARGELAAWCLVVFGLTYATWSVLRVAQARRTARTGAGASAGDHGHAAAPEGATAAGTTLVPWSLFLVFVFGPCEPLVPLLMAPAVQHDWATVAAVCAAFGAVTVGTMLGLVVLGLGILKPAPLGRLERHAGAIAGLAIAATGLAVLHAGI